MQKTKIEYSGEVWFGVPEYPGYYASSSGNILSMKKKSPTIMKQISASKSGHMYVFMYKNNKMTKVWVHRAVLSAFVGPCAQNQECRHLDDNPKNNTLGNLCWGTRLENVSDKRRNGGIPVGERAGTHKLTEKQVIALKEERKGNTLRSLAKKYGVSHTCIRRATLGIKWSYLSMEAGNAKN